MATFVEFTAVKLLVEREILEFASFLGRRHFAVRAKRNFVVCVSGNERHRSARKLLADNRSLEYKEKTSKREEKEE